MKIVRNNKIEDILKRMNAIQLLAFVLYSESKIDDSQYELLINNSLGTLNQIGGRELVSRSKEFIESTIGGQNETQQF